jgi:glycerol-3-phosphate acyltransferase PlsY
VLAALAVESSGGALDAAGERSLPVLTGVAAIVGHVYPVFLRFRGGKGVATSFGVMAALSYPASLAAGIVWLLLYLWTRTVSIASLASALALPAAAAIVQRGQPGYLLVLSFAAAVSLLIIWRHRSNIARLWRGEEHSFGVKK